jgi:uncharacterized protein YaaR (DUF327 family)
VTINKPSASSDTSKYKSFSKNKKLVKETVKSMRKAIYTANSINQMSNPLEYKSAWNNVFVWSNELRKTIETCNNDLAQELMNNEVTIFPPIIDTTYESSIEADFE